MGVHIDVINAGIDLADRYYLESFKAEIRKEILFLKDKITELETKLEDPFG